MISESPAFSGWDISGGHRGLDLPPSTVSRESNHSIPNMGAGAAGFAGLHPSLILNYNLDGLVADQCGRQHRVINAHAVVDPWYGSPSAESIMPTIRQFNFSLPADDLICAFQSTMRTKA
jgi:hypothetical protein